MDKKVENFLQAVADKILLENAPAILSKLDGAGFQKLVLDTATDLNDQAGYGLQVRGTPPQAFPDMVVNRTGVEIKATIKDHWKTTGNSISESRRDVEIDEVVFFFGKLGGTPGIKIRPYSDCLSTILVTHNPRYEVNMDLGFGNSIFDLMGTTYDDFRKRGYPIKEIRDFLRKNLKPGEELWWMGDIETVSQPVLHNFPRRDPRRERFLLLGLALHPEILGSSPDKFNRLPGLLVRRFSAVTPNIRDYFSAGGQRDYADSSADLHRVRAIDYKLLSNAARIKDLIYDESESELLESWQVKSINGDRLAHYIQNLKAISRRSKLKYDLGDLFSDAIQS